MWPKFVYLLFVLAIAVYFWYSLRFSKVALEIDDLAEKNNKIKTFLWLVWSVLWVTGCYFFGYLIGYIVFNMIADWS